MQFTGEVIDINELKGRVRVEKITGVEGYMVVISIPFVEKETARWVMDRYIAASPKEE